MDFRLIAAVLLGLIPVVSSCDSEKDSVNTVEDQEREAEAQALASEKFWGVVGQLISYTDIVYDYKGKTFYPVIGTASESDPLTRIVGTNSLAAAVERFNNLTGAGITTSTTTYTYDDPDVGTLTWTKTTDGTSWGTVEVNIIQIPTLSRIVYQSVEQGNDNGSFDGRAYYRFGDVISATDRKTEETEYWICVRPAFGKEGKEKSHWVNIGKLQDNNIYSISGWKKNPERSFWLPTKLGEDKEFMQDFAEMLYAISFPEKWSQDAYKGFIKGLKIFNDFKLENLDYHNQNFWQNVQDAWVENEVITRILNLKSLSELQEIKDKGVHLLYKGYSWPINYCHLWEAIYTNGNSANEMNLHKATYTEKPEVDMRTVTKDIDFRRGGSNNKEKYNTFFGDDQYRWVIRHATGEELSKRFGNGLYDKRSPIPGTEAFYRYYHNVLDTDDLLATPEVTPDPVVSKKLDNPVVGCIIATDGKFYDQPSRSVQAAAVVVYVGDRGSVETGRNYRGLAVATKDILNIQFQTNEDREKQCPITIEKEDGSDMPAILDGIACTAKLAAGCGDLHHDHPAARYCANYSVISADVRLANGLSDWFIPSTGQWILAMKGIGMSYDANEKEFTGDFKNCIGKMKYDEYKYNYGFSTDNIYYHTSTAAFELYSVSSFKSLHLKYSSKYYAFCDYSRIGTMSLRPFIAF